MRPTASSPVRSIGEKDDKAGLARVLAGLVPRAVVLSVAFYALTFCVKVVRSERHNFVLNTHRALSLRSFAIFANGARDEKVKDAVLMQAATAIFTPQALGSSGDAPETLPQAAALEMLGRLTAK